MPREQRPLVILIAVLVLAAFALELANGRFWLSDFRVYYGAAEALLQVNPVYGVPFGEDTGYYKYAPVVAIAFVPFALLPYTLAALIHFALIGLALGLTLTRIEKLLMRHMFGAYPPRILFRAVLALLCIAVLLSRELHLGNINLWLVAGVLLATEAALEENDALAGVLFGMIWLTKPYLVFLAVPLVVATRWKILRNAAIAVAVGILIPALVLGPQHSLALHRAWLEAMAAHSGYLSSPDTFMSIAAGCCDTWVPVQHPRLVIVVVGLAFTLLCWWQRVSTIKGNRALAMQLWTAFALVPHLVITDQEHFLYSLPLIAFILGSLFQHRSPLISVLFLLAMLGYATRSSDLWGSGLEGLFVNAGALGMGNLLLVICAWALRGR